MEATEISQDNEFPVVSVGEFLDLSSEEMAVIDMQIALSRLLREKREAAGLTQQEVAHRIGTSPFQIAELENGSSGVTLDLLAHALLGTGAAISEIASAIASVEISSPSATDTPTPEANIAISPPLAASVMLRS